MDYILKANLVLLLFFLFYQFILKRHTFFNANRWFLLVGLVISVLIPLVTITNYIYYEPVIFNTNANFNLLLTEAIVNDSPKSFDYISWVFYAYSVGIAVFFIKLLADIKSLFNLISNSEKEPNKGHKLVLNEQNTAPFSFFKWIVVNPKQFNKKELDLVLQHEIVHVKEYHSIDVMLSQLFAIMFWYNPIAWFYKIELQQNLEFIADQKVHDQSAHQHLYQKLLLKTSIPNQELAFTTTFYNSTIKKRIVMLHKSKSKPIFKLQFLLIIPVLAVFLLSMNTKDVYVPLEVEFPVNDTTSNAKDIKVIFTKDMSDQTLESIKADLKKNDILMIIKKISRNNEDEIIEIDVDFETKNGTANYMRGNPNGIIPFYFEMNSSDGGFGVGTVIINLTEDEIIKINKLVDQQIESFLAQTGGTLEELLKFYKKNSLTELREEMIEINKNMYKVGKMQNTIQTEKDSVWVNSFSKSFNSKANDTIIVQISEKIINEKEDNKTDSLNMNTLKYKFLLRKAMTSNAMYLNDSIKDINASMSPSKWSYTVNPGSTNNVVFIIDDILVDRKEINRLNPNDIDSVTVITDKTKLNSLGYKNKDGFINIKTNSLSNHLALRPRNTVTNYKVNSVAYINDKKKSKNSITHYIYKETTDEELKLQIKKFKEFGITMSYSKLKRNKNGDISNIKVRLQNNEGQEIEDTFSEKNGAVVMEYGLSNGKLKISKLTE